MPEWLRYDLNFPPWIRIIWVRPHCFKPSRCRSFFFFFFFCASYIQKNCWCDPSRNRSSLRLFRDHRGVRKEVWRHAYRCEARILPCGAIIPLFAYHLPCCAITYFIFTYPAVPFPGFSLAAYPAVHLLILFSLTLLYSFPAFRLPLTLLCPYLFYFHLPCCALNFLRTYPAVPLFLRNITTYPAALILLRPYRAFRVPLTLL